MDYKDAIKKIKKLLDDAKKQGHVIIRVEDIENSFPELKENEDERIRKNLIELFHDTVSNDEIFSDYGLDKTEVLAWLEKQKDTNALIQEASEKAYTEGMRVEKKHWLEKQGESALIEEIKRRKELYSQEKEKAVSSTEKLSLGGRIAMLEELCAFIDVKQGWHNEPEKAYEWLDNNFRVSSF